MIRKACGSFTYQRTFCCSKIITKYNSVLYNILYTSYLTIPHHTFLNPFYLLLILKGDEIDNKGQQQDIFIVVHISMYN